MLIPKVVTSLVNDLIVLNDVRGYEGTVVKIPALAHNVDLTTMAPELLLAESTHLQHLVDAGDITVNSYFDTSSLNANGLATALAGDVVTSSGALAPGAANLGTSAGMAVLAASTITAAGTTTLTGDLGLYPGTSVTGAGLSVSGTEHVTDAAAQEAQTDAMSAYTDLQGRGSATDESGNVLGTGGTVPSLSAGVYKFTSSAQITGTLTLTGSATDVFIFQIGSTLTTASASSVVLSGGVLAQNVFWAVGSSATLGASSTFKGTILALDSISVGDSAATSGHLMALTFAVTFAGTGNSVISSGEPVGTAMATVTSVGGSTAAAIHTSQLATAAATAANTASTLVARDSSGNFVAGTITANLIGNASTVTTNANLTGMVTSVGNATTVVTNANLTGDVTSVGNATTLVNIPAISGANLTGTAASLTVGTAANFTGALSGDVTGTQSATTVVAIQGNPVTAGVPGAGTVLTFNSGSASWVAPTTGSNVLAFDSSVYAGGAATAALTVTGLLSTDTILSVTPIVTTTATVALNGFSTQINDGLTVTWTADPGSGSTVRVAVKR